MGGRSYKIGRNVSRWLGAVECLGFPGASRLLHEAYSGISRKNNYEVNVPGLHQPVKIRKNSTDINVFMQIFAMGEYALDNFAQSSKIFQRYNNLVSRGIRPLIIDCGANSGMATLWWRKMFPLAKIVAIEAAADNFAALTRNTSGDAAIKCVHAAVWSHKTTVKLDNPADDMWAFRFSEESAPTSESRSGLTDTVTIQEIVEEEADWERVLLVKIDIEGGERQLFSENTDWIGRVPLIIIETHDSLQPYDKTSLNFFRAVSAYDFEVCFSGENAFVYLS